MKQLLPWLTASGILLPPLLAAMYVWIKWQKLGRDPRNRGVIVPEYLPPKSLNALSSDVILQEDVRTSAVTALLIELAVKGYIRIYETQSKSLLKRAEYELELIKMPDGLSHEEIEVLQAIFGSELMINQRKKLKDLQNKFYTNMVKLRKDVPKRLFEYGYFAHDPNKIKNKFRLIGVFIMAGGGSLFFLIESDWLGMLGVGIALAGLIVLLTARIMPARTVKGVEMRDYLLGLKDYMQLTEADRIKFLQSPKGVRQYGDPTKSQNQIKLFEKLLPYAMLFGIEKDWVKQFQHLYTEAPNWYSGNTQTFHSMHFVSSLGNFKSASIASFGSPSNSGSSGFSGGGGFAGGGGGGW